MRIDAGLKTYQNENIFLSCRSMSDDIWRFQRAVLQLKAFLAKTDTVVTAKRVYFKPSQASML
jgi:hypothetical protein